jgi:uncharacterized GH25 family protein
VAWTAYDPVAVGHGEGGGRNLYVLSAKAVINAGGASGDFPAKPLGKARLELVSMANPSGLKAGGELGILTLFDGKPLAGAEILGEFRGFNPPGGSGEAKAFYSRTNRDGKAGFLPAVGGLWILTVKHTLEGDVTDSSGEGADRTVFVSNITFQVKGRRTP